MAPPVMTATSSEPPIEMMRSTGLSDSFTSWPAIKTVWSLGRSSRWARLRAEKIPNKMRNVSAAKHAKMPHCSPRAFQNTSPYPSELNHSKSTQ